MNPKSKVPALVLLGFVVWFTAAWINIFWFTCPSADTWCYMGPAAGGGTPFHLSALFLGEFLRSNEVWGLHFPAAPLFYSAVFAVVKFQPAVGIALMLALWALLGFASGRIAFQATRQVFWSVVAGAIVLVDHSMLSVVQFERPELLASLDLILVWFALSGAAPLNRRFRGAIAFFAAFFLPLVHPVTLVMGPAIGLILWLGTRNEKQVRRPTLTLAAFGYIAGFATLVLWFVLQPDAWKQFSDHASVASGTYNYGRTFVYALWHFYTPTFTGCFLWGIAIVFCVPIVLRSIRSGEGGNMVLCIGGAMLLLGVIFLQKFSNEYYIAVLLPEAACMAVVFLHRLDADILGGKRHQGFIALTILFVAAHSLVWATRTKKFVDAGEPRIRDELRGIVQGLPHLHHVLIPEVLWEAALPLTGSYRLNTLPQMATAARRLSYENTVYPQLESGDIVIVDRLQLNQPMEQCDRVSFTAIANFKHLFPGRIVWGYDLTVWRKN
jgi:hypothetical protein